MKAKRSAPVRGDERRRSPRQPVRKAPRRGVEASPRRGRPTRDSRSAPQTAPIARPAELPARPKNASQAKARAKARKAKAPKVVRPPLRERLLIKLSSIELSPRALIARVPFVVLVIGSLGLGLGITLWLSTGAAERSYQLGAARQANQALAQQKEALERDVLEAQAAPALAEAARNLGMIPSRDTAHLVQDPAGNWVVVGTPKPAEGVPPPPLNTPIPDATPAPAPPRPAAQAAAPRVIDPREVPVRVTTRGQTAVPQGEVPHLAPGAQPQPPAPGPVAAPLDAALAPVPAPAAPPVPAPAALPAPAPAPMLPPLPAPAPDHLAAPQAPVQAGPPA
jgi:cell division protein FtsB